MDMRDPNKAITCKKQPTPTMEELFNDLNGVKLFSKLDMNHSYVQLELNPESCYITSFFTHRGLKRYTHLNFWYNFKCRNIPKCHSTDHLKHQEGKKFLWWHNRFRCRLQHFNRKNLTHWMIRNACSTKPCLNFVAQCSQLKAYHQIQRKSVHWKKPDLPPMHLHSTVFSAWCNTACATSQVLQP